jgi:hypothetical protein
VSLTDYQVDSLLAAYLERKKFEAKIMLSVVSEALQPKQEQGTLASLAMAGFGIKGAEKLL